MYKRKYETYPSSFRRKAVSFQPLSTLFSNHRKSIQPSSLPPTRHFKRSPCYSRALEVHLLCPVSRTDVDHGKHLISDLDTNTLLTRSASPCVMKIPNIRASQTTRLYHQFSYTLWGRRSIYGKHQTNSPIIKVGTIIVLQRNMIFGIILDVVDGRTSACFGHRNKY